MFTKSQQFVFLVQTEFLIYAIQEPAKCKRGIMMTYLNDAFKVAQKIPERKSAGAAAAEFCEFCISSDTPQEFRWIANALHP